jgi:hypothetical protein
MARLKISLIILVLVVEVAPDLGGLQKFLDARGFVEAVVDAEAQFGSEFQVHAPRDLAAQIALVAVERCHDFLLVAPAERHHIDSREPQVRAHPHLRHRDHLALDHRIMDVAPHQHVGQFVTHKFADAQRA